MQYWRVEILEIAAKIKSFIFLAIVFCSSCVDSDRFQIVGPNEVYDKRTSLVWRRCPVGVHFNSLARNGVCEKSAGSFFTWEEANRFQQYSVIDNPNRWRIPTIHELYGLIDESRTSPALNNHYFPIEFQPKYFERLFWTSTRNDRKGIEENWMIDIETGVHVSGEVIFGKPGVALSGEQRLKVRKGYILLVREK